MLNKKEYFARVVNANRIALRKNKRKKLPKPPIPPKPISQEKLYARMLIEIVNLIENAVKGFLLPALPTLTNQANKFKPITDDFTDDLDRQMKLVTSFLESRIDDEELASQMARHINNFQSTWFNKMFKRVLGVDVFVNQPWLKDQLSAWVATNADLIKNLKDKALHDIKFQVQSGFTQGLRHEEVAKNIMERIGVTKNRAKLIARDQTSKLNSQLNQLKQQQVGITHYVWQTAGDERVRDSHREKQGNTYAWDNPPADTGNPGDDINCRCIALPVFDERLFS